MNKQHNPLGDMSADTFLKEYWQQRPLLIKQAFPAFESPVSADELAGLACEEDVNSRIIIEQGGEYPWQVIDGPMNESIFSTMPEKHWTLVVNDMEKYLPELAWITDEFRFIPEWYLDDLMTSWAAPGGSVGAHLDLYDVFILQGNGKRRWKISTRPADRENEIPDIAIRLQKDFVAEHEWILEPGDMMYLPAGVSHHGLSLGESISFSIGFRATSHADLVNDFIGYITQDLAIDKTYSLPEQPLQTHANEISTAAIEQVRKLFKTYLDPQHPQLERWFGRYVSDPKIDYVCAAEDVIENLEEINNNKFLLRHPASRFAFTRTGSEVLLFIDGVDYQVSASFAETLCSNREISLEALEKVATAEEKQLLVSLYNHGKLTFSYTIEE